MKKRRLRWFCQKLHNRLYRAQIKETEEEQRCVIIITNKVHSWTLPAHKVQLKTGQGAKSSAVPKRPCKIIAQKGIEKIIYNFTADTFRIFAIECVNKKKTRYSTGCSKVQTFSFRGRGLCRYC